MRRRLVVRWACAATYSMEPRLPGSDIQDQGGGPFFLCRSSLTRLRSLVKPSLVASLTVTAHCHATRVVFVPGKRGVRLSVCTAGRFGTVGLGADVAASWVQAAGTPSKVL